MKIKLRVKIITKDREIIADRLFTHPAYPGELVYSNETQSTGTISFDEINEIEPAYEHGGN